VTTAVNVKTDKKTKKCLTFVKTVKKPSLTQLPKKNTV